MKKLNLRKVEDKFLEKEIKIFTPKDLRAIFGASKRSVQGFLSYNTKKGVFVRLKRGLYVLKRNFPHEFVIANRLYEPSYISLDTALSFYSLIPETVYTVTSVTPKATREFEVNDRLFDYRKIKKKAYAGYVPQKFDGETVYLAAPEKAVADFLYFVYLGKRDFNDRLRKRKINSSELKKYLKLFGQKRMIDFVANLFNKND